MKSLAAGVLMFAVSCTSYAQGTCMSRCEVEFGQGDSRCPRICKGFNDNAKRKKKDAGSEAEAEAAFAAGAAAASAPAAIPKNEPVEPKAVKPASASAQSGK